MSGVTKTARLSTRLASRHASSSAPRRAFRTSTKSLAAQNYTMPALSPTMTEGNIASWKIKEGDSFTAGDVILEIETDKATMDVEAQDDGILFKITAPEGSKGVKVGQRIGVLAEEGDDLGSLEVPSDDTKSASSSSSKAEDTKSPGSGKAMDAEKSGKQQREEPESAEMALATERTAADTPPKKASEQGGKPTKQSYPLFPAVQQLLHQNGLTNADANKIPASGPGGRVLKGDVLAYLGQIQKDYPSQSSARLEKLTHLDLSNIQLAKPAPKPETAAPSKETPPALSLPAETEVAVPISLTAVISTQKRVQDSLGIFLPLSVFIARASELANSDLPASKGAKPTADDLFNSVLGLDQVPKSTRGDYIPQVTGVSPLPPVEPVRASRRADIIDILAPKGAKSKVVSRTEVAAALGISAGDNVFSVTAKSGDEGRATEYLERLKLALEKEPGRLVV